MASIDAILTNSGSEPQLRKRRSKRKRWRYAMVAVTLFTVAGTAMAFLPRLRTSQDHQSLVTHTIERGELLVTTTEQGTLESGNNTEIKCKVRGSNTIIYVIENGTEVEPGEELVRLDTLMIEEEISERTKFLHLSRSTAERSKADVANAELAVLEYLEGSFVTQLAGLETQLAIAESRMVTTENMLRHAKMMAESSYVSELDVEEKEFALEQAQLDVALKKTQIEVLKEFTKAEQLATLEGNLNAAKAQHEANLERWNANKQRLLIAEDELKQCVVKAAHHGFVIYPTAKQWEQAPDIEEGATVHKDQVLLLMPDLSKMHVKVGIHESLIKRIRPGLRAEVTLPRQTLIGELSTIAPVAQPAGWWTGNVVKYDTVIELPSVEGLKPGMTAEVEVLLARHEDVLTIPTAAVVESSQGHACWIKTNSGTERRSIEIGDGSDMFLVLMSGLEEGDEVVLNPLAYIEQAQKEAALTLDQSDPDEPIIDDY